MTRAVFLDRDGVLNEPVIREGRPYPPSKLEDLKIYPAASAALARLKHAGFVLLVVTNQPDVVRGTQARQTVEEMNAKIGAILPVDGFFVCWHDNADNCDCRKPKPGLLLSAAAQHQIDLQSSFLIGDRWRDIDAGAAVGCRTVLVDHDYRERLPKHAPDFRANSLQQAVDWIIAVSTTDQRTKPDLRASS